MVPILGTKNGLKIETENGSHSEQVDFKNGPQPGAANETKSGSNRAENWAQVGLMGVHLGLALISASGQRLLKVMAMLCQPLLSQPIYDKPCHLGEGRGEGNP